MSASIHVSAPHARWRHTRTRDLLGRFMRWLLRQTLVFASLVATLALGLYTQIHEGAWASWLARDFSAAVYALAWCLGLALLRPRARPLVLGATALVICFAVELSQLWHPYWLEVPRATLLGRLVLGSTFMWSDLAYYAAGAGAGALWLRLLPFRRPRRDDVVDDFVRPMGVRPL